ncbi:MAG TPA: hypothetical protein VIJ28_23610 [Chloroflexota bacterium]|jgi:hypothetical protein
MGKDLVSGLGAILPWSSPPEDKGPTEGNHRLTALTGGLLIPLLALIFLTGLFMDAWWHIHYAVGFVLIPVVVLKLASTGYRALRYYTGNPTYRAAGPPDLLPRLLAPLLAISVIIALATGVALYVQHTRGGVLSTLHTDSAVCSAILIGLHLLTYVPDALAAVLREPRVHLSRPASLRVVAAGVALVFGIILATLTYSSGVWPARPHDRGNGSGVSLISPDGLTAMAGSIPTCIMLL